MPASVGYTGWLMEKTKAQVLVLAQLSNTLHAIPSAVADFVQLVATHYLRPVRSEKRAKRNMQAENTVIACAYVYAPQKK